MLRRLGSLRDEAETLFLGSGPVVGVGIGKSKARPELVFLLESESKDSMQSVSSWATKNGVAIRFVVTGRINALSKA